MGITNVGDYRRRLKQLMTSINDYRSKKVFPPADWPGDLSGYEICLENDCGSLMVTNTGQIIVPSNIAIFRCVAIPATAGDKMGGGVCVYGMHEN